MSSATEARLDMFIKSINPTAITLKIVVSVWFLKGTAMFRGISNAASRMGIRKRGPNMSFDGRTTYSVMAIPRATVAGHRGSLFKWWINAESYLGRITATTTLTIDTITSFEIWLIAQSVVELAPSLQPIERKPHLKCGASPSSDFRNDHAYRGAPLLHLERQHLCCVKFYLNCQSKLLLIVISLLMHLVACASRWTGRWITLGPRNFDQVGCDSWLALLKMGTSLHGCTTNVVNYVSIGMANFSKAIG